MRVSRSCSRMPGLFTGRCRKHPVLEKSVVELVCDPAGSDCRWIIRPNQSLSWRGLLWIYAVVAVCLLGMSVAFALQGFWPVLPFAGLELLALGAAFYLCLARSQWREIVSIDADVVRACGIQHLVAGNQTRIDFLHDASVAHFDNMRHLPR